MGKRIELSPHLTADELASRYRGCTEPVERSHWQMLWLLASGQTTEQVAEVTGYSRVWVRRIALRYSREGPDGVKNQRRGRAGRPPLLTAADEAELAAALAQPHPGGELWNSATVAAWIAQRLGRPVNSRQGWVYLRKVGYTLQVPRPRSTQADPAAQAAFKKGALDEPCTRCASAIPPAGSRSGAWTSTGSG